MCPHTGSDRCTPSTCVRWPMSFDRPHVRHWCVGCVRSGAYELGGLRWWQWCGHHIARISLSLPSSHPMKVDRRVFSEAQSPLVLLLELCSGVIFWKASAMSLLGVSSITPFLSYRLFQEWKLRKKLVKFRNSKKATCMYCGPGTGLIDIKLISFTINCY